MISAVFSHVITAKMNEYSIIFPFLYFLFCAYFCITFSRFFFICNWNSFLN